VLEYKGFFSSVNRKGVGKYCGKVTGVNAAGQDIEAASLYQLRQKFEEIVDEFLHRQASGFTHRNTKRSNEPPDGMN
jgi:hypothetical protein